MTSTSSVDNDEPLEATPYEHYWWDCPACQGTNDAGDIEPNGEEECEDCGAKVEVRR